MTKRKREDTTYAAPAWSGVIDSEEFKLRVQNTWEKLPRSVRDRSETGTFDPSEKFEDLKILSGSALCEDRIQKAVKKWKRHRSQKKMSHIEFAQTLKMPSLPKCENIWKDLRSRRKDRAEKQSKIETNSWTYLRKSYRKKKIQETKGELLVVDKSLVLYHVCIFNSIHSSQAGRLMKEMIFLENHELRHLAKQVTCQARHKVTRGFFVINGAVYCDREVDCAAFLKKQRQQFLENPGDSTTHYYMMRRMKDTYISDLRIELGTPFFFIHGECQHQIVFTNIRLSNGKKDRMNIREYPMPVYEQLKRRQKCCVCVDHTATKVTYNDIYATQSPCFWCLNCFQEFHYKVDGTKLYEDFQEANYVHD